jgi:ABC-2 type transport system permease protein
MAGAFLAIGSFVSAMTKNQVIAFILAATLSFVFTMSGFEMVQNAVKSWLPDFVTEAISSMSVLAHFERITRGVLEAPTLVFFTSMIVFFLFATVLAVDQKKAE